MILIKSGIPYDYDEEKNSLMGCHLESVRCKIIFGSTSIVVGVCYRSGNLNDEDLLCQALTTNSRKTLIMGDFNFPDINWEFDTARTSSGERFIELIRENFFNQSVKVPTRQDNILDLVLSSPELVISDINMSEPLGDSDHLIITGKLSCERDPIIRKFVGFNFKKADYKSISSSLALINWKRELADNNFNEAWRFFKNLIRDLMKRFIPSIKFKNKKGIEWMTSTVKTEISHKKRLWAAYRTINDASSYDAFRKQAKITIEAVKVAKIDYKEKLPKASKTNPRGIFRYIAKKKCIGDVRVKDDCGGYYFRHCHCG